MLHQCGGQAKDLAVLSLATGGVLLDAGVDALEITKYIDKKFLVKDMCS